MWQINTCEWYGSYGGDTNGIQHSKGVKQANKRDGQEMLHKRYKAIWRERRLWIPLCSTCYSRYWTTERYYHFYWTIERHYHFCLPDAFLSTSLISVHIPEYLKNTNLTFRHWFTLYTKGHKNISSFTFEFFKHTERRTVKYKLTCQNMGHYGAASTQYPMFFFSGQQDKLI